MRNSEDRLAKIEKRPAKTPLASPIYCLALISAPRRLQCLYAN